MLLSDSEPLISFPLVNDPITCALVPPHTTHVHEMTQHQFIPLSTLKQLSNIIYHKTSKRDPKMTPKSFKRLNNPSTFSTIIPVQIREKASEPDSRRGCRQAHGRHRRKYHKTSQMPAPKNIIAPITNK